MISVLLVDDSLLLRERLRQRLGAIVGVRVVGEADNVTTAVDAFHRLLPAVVVLDLHMPGGTGLDVLAHIKEYHPHTTVIVLTNYPLRQLEKKCLTAGAGYFFDKSTQFDEVTEVLRRLSAASSAHHGELPPASLHP